MFRRILDFILRIDHRDTNDPRDGMADENASLGATVSRSGMVTSTLIVMLVAVSVFAYFERGRGNLKRIQRHIEAPSAPVAAPPMPGGMAAVVLSRSQMIGEGAPQFLSATLLPGRGVNMLQITAYLPGRGVINLLDSPTPEAAAKLMTGSGEDRNGALSLTMGGAPMVPWAGAIDGTSVGADTIATTWQGRTLHLPVASANEAGGAQAIGGLLLDQKAIASDSTAMPDGSATTMTFHAGDFGGHWPSATDVTVSTVLSGRAVELTISAKNVGTEAEPMGIGWQPRFALHGQRQNILLKVPGSSLVEEQKGSHLPTGRLVAVESTPYDLRNRNGAHLPANGLDATYTNLVTGFLDDGPVIEMTDAASSYGLRIKLLSTTIHAIHVAAPAGGRYVEIAPEFNLDDPFGREWGKDVDTGMKVLEPGQAAEWKIRMELFDPGAQTKSDSLMDTMPHLPGGRSPAIP